MNEMALPTNEMAPINLSRWPSRPLIEMALPTLIYPDANPNLSPVPGDPNPNLSPVPGVRQRVRGGSAARRASRARSARQVAPPLSFLGRAASACGAADEGLRRETSLECSRCR